MNAVSPTAPTTPAPNDAGSLEPVSEALDHFRSIATMLELIDRLPDLAEDIRNWRPRDPFPGDAAPLEQVARHAFDAVVTGLNMLGVAAATLCENSQGGLTPDEIVVCQEIGAAMTSLFERAKALLATDDEDFPTQRARLYRSLLRENPRDPASPG